MAEQIVDAKGRVLVLRDLNVLEQVRLLRAIGPAQSENQPYVNMVQAVATVLSVDGVPLPAMVNERSIDACIERVGEEGFGALIVRMRKITAEVEAVALAASETASQNGAQSGPLEVPA